jgi:predicted RNase H-like nuclease
MPAREFVGPRRSSVFPVPPRAVLEANSYEEALSLSRKLIGKGITRQSWALRDKILDADSVSAAEPRIHEVHPEVSFCAMAGAPLAYAKRTWNGQAQRKALLTQAGIELPDDIGPAAAVPVDDVLDAAASAWSALRIAAGEARTLPRDPGPREPTISF